MTQALFKVDVTYPANSDCQPIAKKAIEMQLAICVQIIPAITSYYQWDGAVASDTEQLISFKCLTKQHDHLVRYIKEHHPYDIPQCITYQATDVNEDYMKWAKRIN